jgi:hypothetical protein
VPNMCPQGLVETLGTSIVHAAHGKSNVLSPAAKSFVTTSRGREAVYNFFLHERYVNVSSRAYLYKISKKVGSMGRCYDMNEQTPHLSALRNG